MKTKNVILSQLKENTGTHFLDSGGAYGRHWQRNQKKLWAELDTGLTWTFYARTNHDGKLDVDATISLASWMANNLEYHSGLQRCFDKFARKHPDNYDMTNMENFVRKSGRGNSTGIFYTYNDENSLSQDIQFIQFNWGYFEEPHVLLQVHGGCDARGGMGSPRAYKCREDMGDWRVSGYSAGRHTQWDESGRPDNSEDPHLFKSPALMFEYESTLAADIENLKNTYHYCPATVEKMKVEDARLEAEAWDNFDKEGVIVVYKGKAYYDGEEIMPWASGLMG